jgi:endonuclease/exonuclease/phosphatase family metal-dependent hydrolase
MNGSSSSENSNLFNSTNKKVTYYHPLCELNLTQFQMSESNHDILLKRREQEIRILTYNIFLRSLVKNNESDLKEERLEDFCRILHNYDIICLQEMFGTFNSRKQSLIRAATIAGFFFFVDTASPDFLSKYLADGGLIILSRFPIVANSYHKFRYGVVADSLAEKGLIYAKIAIKDSYLHIFTTHLQASYFDSGETNFIASFRTRMDQLSHINYLMSEILTKEYDKRTDKIMLVGDLNVDALGYAYKPLV